jgi:tetratricopeptide (TPR) repeat protein
MNPPTTATSVVDRSGELSPGPELRRRVVVQLEKANALIATGDYTKGLGLLLDCCKLDPGNLILRQTLRRAQKARLSHRPRRSWFAWLCAWPLRNRIRAALRAGRYLDVLHLGERLLVSDPWDVPAQLEMATAAERLGLPELAIWNLEQARQKDPNAAEPNRRLARLYEFRGNFTQALGLWELILTTAPHDDEARRKVAELTGPATPLVSPVQLQIEQLRLQTEQEPTNAEVRLQLARAYRSADLLDEARNTLLEGLAVTGNAFELSVELTDLMIEPFRRDLLMTEQKIAQIHDTPQANYLVIRDRLLREVLSRELHLHRALADRFPTRLQHRYEVLLRLVDLDQLDEAAEELPSLKGDEELVFAVILRLARGYRRRGSTRLTNLWVTKARALATTEPRKLALAEFEAGERRESIL